MNKKSNKLLGSALTAAMLLNGFGTTVQATTTVVEPARLQSEDKPETETPAPVQEETPAPAKEETPAPAKEETPETETAPEEEKKEEKKEEDKTSGTISDSYSTPTFNVDEVIKNVDVDTSGVISDAHEAVVKKTSGETGDVKIDEKDPVIETVKEELNQMKVTNEDGEKVPLTEEQKQQVLGMFQRYMDNWAQNADIFGVQMPFYLNFNDNKDELGVLGEMLANANVPVDAVRSGDFKYENLTGMISNFVFGDSLGAQYYGDAIRSKRDAAMQAVKDSGATTEVQKLLVLNDWLASHVNFDMGYIMNVDKDTPAMVALNGAEAARNPHYEDVHNKIYNDYLPDIKQQIEAQVREEILASLRIEFWKGAITQVVYQSKITEESTDEEKKAAQDEAKKFVEDNNDAIKENPKTFVKEQLHLEDDVANQMEAGVEENLDKVQSEKGLDTKDENGNPVNLQIDEMVAATRIPLKDDNGEVKKDENGEDITISIDQAAQAGATQAADGLTGGIMGYWNGSHIGAFGESQGVCLAYAKAYAYLVQVMHSDIYTNTGNYKDAADWKKPADIYYDADGNLDINANYNVDLVRITYDADVSMFGEPQENFGADHFWNAVKVDGKWYYVDTTYTDAYTQVMSRDRVETDGAINHLYFMLSDATTRELYDGNFKHITTLYQDVATDTTYETAWFARAKSSVSMDGSKVYYTYDSTDLIDALRNANDFNNGNSDGFSMSTDDARLKLVTRDLSKADAGDGDTDYTTLIDFNAPVTDEDGNETTEVQVLDKDGNLVKNEMLTKLFAEHKAMTKIYPSLQISCVYNDGALLFNLSKYILSYDLASGEVKVLKSYDTASGTRNKNKTFGGLAFSLVNEGGDFTFKNHPIAGMDKVDGNLNIAIATNLAFISGKDDGTRDTSDQSKAYINDGTNPSGSYGYEFEETNYNPSYNSYMNEKFGDMGAQMGYEKEVNDNDEFMWAANFRGTEDLAALTGSTAEYKEAKCEHHWIKHAEQYFTKTDDGAWNTGNAYVCTKCLEHVTEPGAEPEKTQMESDEDFAKRQKNYEEQKALWEEASSHEGHIYTAVEPEWDDENSKVKVTTLKDDECRGNKLDLQHTDDNLDMTLEEAVTLDTTSKTTGKCDEGTVTTTTASGTTDKGVRITASKSVQNEPGEHAFEAEWTWAEDNKSATVSVKCPVDGTEYKDVAATVKKDEEKSKAATCKEAGVDVLVATAEIKNDKDEVIATVTDTKNVEIPQLAHEFEEPAITWNEDNSHVTATIKCKNCEEEFNAEADSVLDEEKSDVATCQKAGKHVYNVTLEFKDADGKVVETVTDTKTVEVAKLDHKFEKYVVEWDGFKSATATAKCENGGEEYTATADAVLNEEKSTKPTCAEEGKNVYEATLEFKDADGNVIYKSVATNTENLDKLPHELEDKASFEWDGYSVKKATISCKTDKGHVLTDNDVDVEIIDSKDPTSKENGYNKYRATATFDNNGTTVTKTEEKTEVLEAIPVKTQTMYRLYNPNSGEHFYTASTEEKDHLNKLGWNFEGTGWIAPEKSKTPVYRLYNPNAGDHHYTTSQVEKEHLMSVGWKDEGVGWYSDDEETVPLFRQYNPNAKAGAHNYTASRTENDYLVSKGWKAEGIGWYAVRDK